MPASPKKRPRGRPSLDLAIRLRNWVWYWLVRTESNLSDDALDAKYVRVMSGERPRLFFRIKSGGSSPDELRGYHSHKSIYELVHEAGEFEAARLWFESPLWRFLTEPNLKPADFTAFIGVQLKRRGLFRARPEDLLPGRAVLGDDEPAFETGLTDNYQKSLRIAAMMCEMQTISLLAALFREAHGEFEAEIARHIEEKLMETIEHYLRTLPIPNRPKRCFRLLVQDRILRNRWITEADMPVTPEHSALPRARQVKAFIDWYMSSKIDHLRSSVSTLPIVWNTERMHWYQVNRARVYEIWNSGPKVDWDKVQRDEDWLKDEMDGDPDRGRDPFGFNAVFEKIAEEHKNQNRRREMLRSLDGIPPRQGATEIPRILIEPEQFSEFCKKSIVALRGNPGGG